MVMRPTLPHQANYRQEKYFPDAVDTALPHSVICSHRVAIPRRKERKLINLETITLDKGKHDKPSNGSCLLEVVSLFAGEPFGDRPQCVCPALASFGRAWNDLLDNNRRQSLKRYVPMLVGSNQGRELSVLRGYMAADWAARTCVPMMFYLFPKHAKRAAKLRALAPITDKASASEAMYALDLMRSELRRAAAADAAYAATYAVAYGVAADAADAAAYAVADAAAYAVAYAAGTATSADAAADATAYAADAAAAAATTAAAVAVADDAGEKMHQSAHDLFARMIAARLPVKDAA
jgi:hypothetical protein